MKATSTVLLLALLAGCAGDPTPVLVEADADTDADSDTDADTDTDTDADTDTDTDTDTDADTDPGVCVEDASEDNDDFATALPLPASTVDLAVLSADADYFTITVPAGERLTVDALFIDDFGDIDIALFDDLEESLDSSASSSDDEQVTYANFGSTDVVVTLEVELYAGASCATYDLVVVTTPLPTCVTPDAFEENDTPETAAVLAAGVTTGLEVASGDPDHYAVDVPPGDRLFVVADTLSPDLGIELFDGAGLSLDLRDSYAPFDIEERNTGTAVETWVVAVDNDDVPCVAYDLDVRVIPAICGADDANEPNDTEADAVPVPANATALTVDSESPDYFTVSAQAGEHLTVAVENASSPVGLALYDDTGSELASDAYAPYEVDVVASEAGTWTVGIDADDCTTYDLVTAVQLATCATTDALEPNDEGSPATISGAQTGLSVDFLDVDAFTTTVSAQSQFFASLAGVNGDGIDEVVLVDNSGGELDVDGFAPFEVSWTNNDAAPADVTVVVVADGLCTTYDLTLLETGCPADDTYEPNDDYASAVALPSGTTGLVVSGASKDYFSLGTVADGEVMNVDLTFLHADGDIDADLRDASDGSDLSAVGGGSTDDDEFLLWTNTTGAAVDVVLETRLFLGTDCFDSNTYDVTWSITP